MGTSFCTYGDGREDALIAYLYGDIEPGERARFEHHVAACPQCRRELDELGAVRSQLARWSPPGIPRGITVSAQPARRGVAAALRDLPAWAQAAAALLVFGVSAGLANLDVRYDSEGLSVRTGWLDQAPPAATDAAAPDAAVEWRRALAGVERQLRDEMRDARAAAAAPVVAAGRAAGSDRELLDQVRAIVRASEERQQRELALRVAEVLRDVDSRRRADLTNIQRALDVYQNDTVGAVMQQRQMINNLAVRVNQR